MIRARFAIAHFSEGGAAERLMAALLDQGGRPAVLTSEEQNGPCRLRIVLPEGREQAVLKLLLASDALRVDIHDAAPETARD